MMASNDGVIVKRNPHDTLPQHDGTLIMKGAELLFRNFEGREGTYNRAGDRNFAVALDPVTAQEMIEDGWNVRRKDPEDEGEEPRYSLSVTVGLKGRPPNMAMITKRGRTPLLVEDCEILDWLEFINVDLKIRPYHWNVSGKSGIKAYLVSLFATVYEDELTEKYNEIPLADEAPQVPDGTVIQGTLVKGELEA
jgi:hypothetical protein